MSTGTTLARGLGVFSLGLGLVQVAGPRRFARWIGVRPDPERVTATRLVGIRELGAAGALLVTRKPVAGQWFRLAGDVIDVGLLARALAARDSQRARVAAALAGVAGIAIIDLVGGIAVTSEAEPRGTSTTTPSGARLIRRAITVQASRQKAYEHWRDFSRLPRFMRHLEAVTVIDDRHSRWRAKAPVGGSAEWDAEITEDLPGELIAWRSVGRSEIANSGTVSFVDAPGDRGTEVHVELEYAPPFGSVGAAVASLFGEEPAQQIADDLRRFKQILETGRVGRSDATVGDRKVRQRPAQPLEPSRVRQEERHLGRAAAATTGAM